jgi:hypothetical protein
MLQSLTRVLSYGGSARFKSPQLHKFFPGQRLYVPSVASAPSLGVRFWERDGSRSCCASPVDAGCCHSTAARWLRQPRPGSHSPGSGAYPGRWSRPGPCRALRPDGSGTDQARPQAGRAFHPDEVERGHDVGAHPGIDREASMSMGRRQACCLRSCVARLA